MAYDCFQTSHVTTFPSHSPPDSHRASASVGHKLAVLEQRYEASIRRRRTLATLLAVVLLVSSAIMLASLLLPHGHGHLRKPTVAISRACNATRHLSHCLATLLGSPGAPEARTHRDLLHVSLDATLRRVANALSDDESAAASFAELQMEGGKAEAAYDDCVELLNDSHDLLQAARTAVLLLPPGRKGTGPNASATYNDVCTWLSAAHTSHDTCLESLQDVPGDGTVKRALMERVQDLAMSVSNCLAIFEAAVKEGEFAGVLTTVQNRKRLMSTGAQGGSGGDLIEGFPEWVRREDRRLLQAPAAELMADFVVSKDGTGSTHTAISQAVEDAPEYSDRPFVIYIKAGSYDEYIKVGKKKTNLVFVGEGKSTTIITGARSVSDFNMSTFKSATFAATGWGFMARDITFQNLAGPEKHQAVALRLGADLAVLYRCDVIGYQDTLYVHSNRHFLRDCDVYGTVDFIFGNAAAVLQNCTLYARRPLPGQKNVVTAQARMDPCNHTGISVHASRVLPADDLAAPVSWSEFPTYLGRPWRLYSTAVFMQSYIAEHVHPAGWLEMNGSFALDTLYYGEYMNSGPGAELGNRVNWTGYRVMTQVEEATKFTVAQFIDGSSWLPSTGISYIPGLTS